MCGIAGFTHSKGSVDPARIRAATNCLVHRGPDEQGVFEAPSVSLGNVRLKIIDLEHGHQPMHSDDGDTTLVFNGEIYNHAEVRAELESQGVRFDSRSDTEVVLRAFLQWDVDSFRKLRGMFAFAVWTESQRRLVLVRDRLGIKPLYFHRRGRDLYFGSELKAILVHPEVERRFSTEGLYHYLSLNYVPAPFTLTDGIEKLPQGTWLEWRNGVERTGSYWNLKLAPENIGFEDAKVELDRLMRESLREHLISDVPLGIWASGGVDSSTVLHYASEATSAQLKTFSVSFQGRKFDESPYFRAIAERYRTDHHEFDLNPEVALADAVLELSYYSDEPSADAGALPVWFLSKMTREHVTVALSGEGADELFGGYQTYLADGYARTARLVPAAARRLGARMAGLLPVSNEKIGLEYKIKRFLNGSLLPPPEAHFFWNGTFTEAEKAELYRYGAPNTGRTLGGAARTLTDFLAIDQRFYLADDILYKCDRMSMAHSLEVRPPFLDHRIVEFAARLPESYKVHGGKLKYILKSLMRDKLPAAILDRPKEGFDIPAHEWLRTPVLKPLFMDAVNRRTVEESGLFRWPVLEKFIRAHMERRANFGYHLWGLLVLFLWMRRWSVEAPAQSAVQYEGVTTA